MTENGGAIVAVDQPGSLLPVVGINFGNSYASIAVVTREGNAECIANEDGERQIACAVSFHGEEIYIGNEAKQQLVKNAPNTITGFRNLLGLRFSELGTATNSNVVQHPDLPDTPAYKVQVLQPSPSPLPRPPTSASVSASAPSSIPPTPRSEPVLVDRHLTVSQVTTLFLKSLLQSAEAFIGSPVHGAVIAVPATFSHPQRAALRSAANDAGIVVLQLVDDVAAAAATTIASSSSSSKKPDRTLLVVDVGASSSSIALLSIRHGLAHGLASSSSSSTSAELIDQKLLHFFAADFAKKTKTPLSLSQDRRAEAKLRLAIEHTKRTLSASPGVATCTVESLAQGLDYAGTINRMRFDILAAPVYAQVATQILALLSQASFDPHDVDEVAYVGGSGCLPGLDALLRVEVGFRDVVDGTSTSTTGDPTTVVSRGCATQAALLFGSVDEEDEMRAALEQRDDGLAAAVRATTRTIGIVVPHDVDDANDNNNNNANKEMGGTWIPIVHKETALPVRRVVSFEMGLGENDDNRIAFEVWEVDEGIRIEKTVLPPLPKEHDDYDDEEEIETKKHRTTSKRTLLGVVDVPAKLGVVRTTGANPNKGGGKGLPKNNNAAARTRKTTRVEVQLIVGLDGDVEVDMTEVGVVDEVEGGGLGAVARVRVPGLCLG